MNWVWESSQAVGNDRLVLLAIADRANDEGRDAWPSVSTLAQKTRLHARTVQRCIKSLLESGELEAEPGGARQRGANIYALRMDRPAAPAAVAPPTQGSGRSGEPGGGGNLSPLADQAVATTDSEDEDPKASAPAHAADCHPSQVERLDDGPTRDLELAGEPASGPPANCHPYIPVDPGSLPPRQIATGGDVATPPPADCHRGGGDVATPPPANCHPIRPVRTVRTSTPSTTAAPTPRTPAELATEPNDTGNYHVVERIAVEVLTSGKPLESDGAFIDAVKWLCARRKVDYGRHPDVQTDIVRRACESASVMVKRSLITTLREKVGA